MNNNNKKNTSNNNKHPQEIGLQISFGKILRSSRLALSLTQEGLAELANLHFTYVSSVERGERNPSLLSMDKLARALQCSLKDLMPY